MTDYKVHRIRFVDFFPKAINATAFDNSSKQARLALSREDGSIEIRNPDADWMVEYIIPGHEKRSVEHLSWCNGRLFSGSVTSDIIEWDLETLQPKYHQDSYGGPVWCLKFSYSKDVVAAGCEDGGIHLFDVLDDSLMYKGCLSKQENRVLCLAWSYDDQFIFYGGFNCSMNKCNVKTGHVVSRMTTDNLKDKNTMVWSMQILKDMTIIIGDSLGNTQFWDGETCTLIQSFQSHVKDVLAVAVSEDEETVYSTGIDSKVTEFKLAPGVIVVSKLRWVMTKSVRATNHDTRTLCVCNEPYNCLVSGGLDPRFIVYPIKDNQFDARTFTKYSCLPVRNICQLADSTNIFLFREQRSIHVWLLSNGIEDDKDNKACKPKKLYQINSDKSDHLISSAVSPNGSYLAYSTVNKGQLFELNISPVASVHKSDVKIPPSTHMRFLHDKRRMITVGHERKINVIDINVGDCHSITFPSNESVKLPFLFLSHSHADSYACVVDAVSNVFIFSLEQDTYINSLPKVSDAITSCTFAPDKNNLFIMTSKKQIYEFSIDEGKFDSWCFEVNSSKLITSTMGDRKDKAVITFNPQSPTEIFIQERGIFGKLVHGSTISSVDMSVSRKEKRKRCEDVFHTIESYSSIMFFDLNHLGEIVLVERSMDSILEKLPPPLKIKQFGS